MPVLIPTGSTPNAAPTVTITSPANGTSFDSGTSISFVGSASDTEDVDLTDSLVWKSDGEQIGIGGSFSTELSVGSHTITASVIDSGGLTGSASITITVTPSSGGQITLSVIARKVKTNKFADLTWTGATSANVDVYRNDIKVITTLNDGAYTDKPSKTTTSATYKVCEAGASTCSNSVTVTW